MVRCDRDFLASSRVENYTFAKKKVPSHPLRNVGTIVYPGQKISASPVTLIAAIAYVAQMIHTETMTLSETQPRCIGIKDNNVVHAACTTIFMCSSIEQR